MAKLISAPQSLAQPQFLDNLYRRRRCLAEAMFCLRAVGDDDHRRRHRRAYGAWQARKFPALRRSLPLTPLPSSLMVNAASRAASPCRIPGYRAAFRGEKRGFERDWWKSRALRELGGADWFDATVGMCGKVEKSGCVPSRHADRLPSAPRCSITSGPDCLRPARSFVGLRDPGNSITLAQSPAVSSLPPAIRCSSCESKFL